mgnify:CR=1 FL=1
MLLPLVRLLQWARRGLGAVTGRPLGECDGGLDIGGAVLLVGAITLAAGMGMPPLLTLGGGIGLAVLFVVARSCIVVRDAPIA